MGDDAWLAGERYDPYMGRWSRLVAPLFVDWLGAGADRRWVDLGCGTAALTSSILAAAEPASVVGVDPSPGFVAWARAHVTDPRASFVVGEVSAVPPESVDVVASGLVLNFLPDGAGAVAAMGAAARGGTVAAYVWDYAGGMQMIHLFWEAVVGLDPGAAGLHEASRFPDCEPGALTALWEGAGLGDVETTELVAERTYGSFEELWGPFLGGTGPSPAYVAALDPAARERVVAAFRDRLPIAADGGITLSARAYAVRGTA